MPQSGKSSKFKFRMLTFNAEPQRFFYIALDMRVHREQPCCLQRTQRFPYTCVIYSFSLCASAFRNKELAKVEFLTFYSVLKRAASHELAQEGMGGEEVNGDVVEAVEHPLETLCLLVVGVVLVYII